MAKAKFGGYMRFNHMDVGPNPIPGDVKVTLSHLRAACEKYGRTEVTARGIFDYLSRNGVVVPDMEDITQRLNDCIQQGVVASREGRVRRGQKVYMETFYCPTPAAPNNARPFHPFEPTGKTMSNMYRDRKVFPKHLAG